MRSRERAFFHAKEFVYFDGEGTKLEDFFGYKGIIFSWRSGKLQLNSEAKMIASRNDTSHEFNLSIDENVLFSIINKILTLNFCF